MLLSHVKGSDRSAAPTGWPRGSRHKTEPGAELKRSRNNLNPGLHLSVPHGLFPKTWAQTASMGGGVVSHHVPHCWGGVSLFCLRSHSSVRASLSGVPLSEPLWPLSHLPSLFSECETEVGRGRGDRAFHQGGLAGWPVNPRFICLCLPNTGVVSVQAHLAFLRGF